MRTTTNTTTTAATTRLPDSLCTHSPTCPTADSPDREAARVVAAHPEQGWSLLCNALVIFDDTGDLLPDGRIVAPHRPTGAADTHPLISGTTRSGTNSAPAFYAAASLASSTSRKA